MLSDVAVRQLDELRHGLTSMTPGELLDATRRALLMVYSPQQAAIWLNAHASGDPVMVAHKALRLCGVSEPTGAVGDGTSSGGSSPSRHAVPEVDEDPRALVHMHGVGPGRGHAPVRRGVVEPTPGPGHRDLEAQRTVTAAVRALFSCQKADEVRTVLLEAVAQLGGQVVRAEDVTEPLIPLELSLGTGPALLAVADPRYPESIEQLQTHLPQLVEDARGVLDRLEHHNQLASAAERDCLTGLLNRRAYERFAGRVSPGDVLVLIDLDGFKQVNDVHGHVVGDQVLRLFGAVLSEEMRISEHAVRLGGDEFLLVLEDPAEGGVAQVLERLRIAWERRRPLPVAFSVGVAGITGSIDRALEAADRDLYEVKRAGQVEGPAPSVG